MAALARVISWRIGTNYMKMFRVPARGNKIMRYEDGTTKKFMEFQEELQMYDPSKMFPRLRRASALDQAGLSVGIILAGCVLALSYDYQDNFTNMKKDPEYIIIKTEKYNRQIEAFEPF
ncbi:uncharacterized protein LOC106159134 [Lingula anatina]|uniref:Uncharacterized protein LOC106159134 n=1 Tax=Lingula anatina TaxID=7574 RepID=A0A1S3HXQ0_LINAN|nr:uncharacterized protein LOC106159134 [Lingula anatina]|eukprot:XP_013390788.1 uncharacterized protein LOC106159134 [Lingula anatina]